MWCAPKTEPAGALRRASGWPSGRATSQSERPSPVALLVAMAERALYARLSPRR